jgi:hypothetical protein
MGRKLLEKSRRMENKHKNKGKVGEKNVVKEQC